MSAFPEATRFPPPVRSVMRQADPLYHIVKPSAFAYTGLPFFSSPVGRYTPFGSGTVTSSLADFEVGISSGSSKSLTSGTALSAFSLAAVSSAGGASSPPQESRKLEKMSRKAQVNNLFIGTSPILRHFRKCAISQR